MQTRHRIDAATQDPGDNAGVAERLREAARLLQARGAEPYRANAYRRAADSIAHLHGDVRRVYDSGGVRALDGIPGVGLGIASAIAEMLESGRWSQLDRLRGATDAIPLFRTVPGIGPELARRIHEELHVETLEALETAAHDGRLEGVRGVGPRRAAALRASLEGMLRRLDATQRDAAAAVDEPPVEQILDVDREYRERAAAGQLRTIAPKRFNAGNESWLPILHARRGRWSFTALFSNTALAHKLGRTRDWVVLYFHDGEGVQRSRTVVTETHGPFAGHRIVRGREAECHRACFATS